jgi:hypothetical protein
MGVTQNEDANSDEGNRPQAKAAEWQHLLGGRLRLISMSACAATTRSDFPYHEEGATTTEGDQQDAQENARPIHVARSPHSFVMVYETASLVIRHPSLPSRGSIGAQSRASQACANTRLGGRMRSTRPAC